MSRYEEMFVEKLKSIQRRFNSGLIQSDEYFMLMHKVSGSRYDTIKAKAKRYSTLVDHEVTYEEIKDTAYHNEGQEGDNEG